MNKQSDASTRANTLLGQIVFLLLSFPMGLLYFLVTVIGLAVGLATTIIWIGIPILFVTLLCIYGMAEIEKRLVRLLLDRQPVSPQPEHSQLTQGLLRRFGSLLKDSSTWISIVYMLLKLPVGIISFTLTLTLLVSSIALTFLPLIYLLNLFVNTILAAHGISNASILIPSFIEIHGTFDPLIFARSFLGVPFGILGWIITHFVLKGLTLLSRSLVRVLLGLDTSTVAQPHQASPYIPEMVVHQISRNN